MVCVKFYTSYWRFGRLGLVNEFRLKFMSENINWHFSVYNLHILNLTMNTRRAEKLHKKIHVPTNFRVFVRRLQVRLSRETWIRVKVM